MQENKQYEKEIDQEKLHFGQNIGEPIDWWLTDWGGLRSNLCSFGNGHWLSYKDPMVACVSTTM